MARATLLPEGKAVRRGVGRRKPNTRAKVLAVILRLVAPPGISKGSFGAGIAEVILRRAALVVQIAIAGASTTGDASVGDAISLGYEMDLHKRVGSLQTVTGVPVVEVLDVRR